MKKLFLAALLLAGFATQAQVTFRPGVRAGVNFSHFTQSDNYYYYNYDPYYTPYNSRRTEFTSKTDFYAGLYGALNLGRFYTLQPEIDFSRQGAYIEYFDSNNFRRKEKIDVSYLSVALINKFRFQNFNIHVGPSIDFVVERPRYLFNPNDPDAFSAPIENEVDLAFTLGVGYNFTKSLGIEARVKKGIVPVYDMSDWGNTNVVFSAGLTYTFDTTAPSK